MKLKLSELQQKTFEGDMIDNCLFVEGFATGADRLYSVTLKSIFDEIIIRAKKEGLKVELQDDRIAFIKL